MRRTVLILAISLLIIAGGVGAYSITTQGKKNDSKTSMTTSQTSDKSVTQADQNKSKPENYSTTKVSPTPNGRDYKPGVDEVKASGTLKQTGNTYILQIENVADQKTVLDPSKYTGDIQAFLDKKVTVSASDVTISDDGSTVTLKVATIVAN